MPLGTNILEKVDSSPEVTNISPYGFWLLAGGREYFVNYKDFPVFEDASIKDVANLVADMEGNLHWPSLDADIELTALERPEDYPLMWK